MVPLVPPGPVAPSFLPEEFEGGSQPSVAPEPELGEKVEPDEDVVVVMVRIVPPEPGRVPRALFEELPLEVELRPSLDGSLHLGEALRLRHNRERRQGLPGVQGAGRALRAVPAPVRALVLHEPVVPPADSAVVSVAEAGQQARGVRRDAHLFMEEVEGELSRGL